MDRRRATSGGAMFPFMETTPAPARGGKREGAGRKAARHGDGSRVHASHAKRARFAKSRPLHVTVELVDGLPNLRDPRMVPVVADAIERSNRREDFRVVHLCLLRSHVHFICEAEGPAALAAGMKGLNVRLAKALNKRLGRTGSVVRERYHVHVLETPREVRNAVAYVLRNGERHGVHVDWPARSAAPRPDPLSSAAWFPYWVERDAVLAPNQVPASVVREARTFLMRRAFEGAPLSFRAGVGRRVARRGGSTRTGMSAESSVGTEAGLEPSLASAPVTPPRVAAPQTPSSRR